MTARKLHNSWWVDFRFGVTRHRRRSPENSAQGARAYERLLLGRLVKGEPLFCSPQPLSPSFSEFATEWMQTYVRINNKPSEQATKESALRNHLLPRFGRRRLTQIAAIDVERYKADCLSRGLSAKTINNHLTILRKCLQTAVDWERLSHIPKIAWLKTIPPQRDFLTIEESAQLVQAADTRLTRAMLLLALRTGMRLGELRGLRWSDVCIDQRCLTVRRSIVRDLETSPKNHHERYVAFPHSVVQALELLGPGEGFVFTQPDGQPLTARMASSIIRRAARRAGLRLIGWHTLRHTCASQIGMLRGTLIEAQRLLGHSSLAMTERYTHIVPTLLHDAVASLDQAASEASRQLGIRWATPVHLDAKSAPAISERVRNLAQVSQKQPLEGVALK